MRKFQEILNYGRNYFKKLLTIFGFIPEPEPPELSESISDIKPDYDYLSGLFTVLGLVRQPPL